MDSYRALPTGVVTFLLTDIEGSTRRWEREPDAMREALARHDWIVNQCVRRLNGHVVKSKGEGDSIFAVFNHGRDAVTAAVVLQSAFETETWATTTPIRVRMAIHTGQIVMRDGDYYGPTVNRCARLRALARGGQVLVSGVTAKLIGGQLPTGASLHDLGTHQLKDLSAPERVWELKHPRMSSAGASAAAPVAPAASVQRAYKLTDHLNRTTDGREWGEGKTHAAVSESHAQAADPIRCYVSPSAAALLNPLNERYRLPRLWEATVDSAPTAGNAMVDCREVTTVRQVPLPTVTGKHHARFAVMCALAAYEGGQYEVEFRDWAAGWLAGQDSPGVDARALAETLGDLGLAVPGEMMLAKAAEAAAHASRLSWLAGHAWDEENARTIECAAEAVHIALRIAQIDVAALAEEVVPKGGAPLTPLRTPSFPGANRILRALPT